MQRLAAMRPEARLPLRIRLDANLVEAAKRRRAIHPVSRCGDALCGVASEEFDDEWDRLTAASLFTPDGADEIKSEAFGAALIDTFHGENVDAVAAALLRANLISSPAALADLNDELLEIPAIASLFRSLDPTHKNSYEELAEQLDHLPPARFAQWIQKLRQLPASHHDTALHLPLLGATFSVINNIGESPISDRSHLEVEHLHDLGYNALALIPFAGQDGPYADEVRMWNRSPESETDLDLQIVSRHAHALGMTLLLKPQVWVGHGTDSLHIDPRGGWEKWFASYRRFILHHAMVARLQGIEWLAVGTELTLTEKQPQWHQLIRDVRALYQGHIVYAANWDAFAATPLWNELDAVGIDVYAPLAKKDDATDAELLQGARANVDEVTRLAAKVEKPVILTELGFPSTRAPWREPWNERRDEPVSHVDQARCYRAFLTALGEAPWFTGLFIWKYESDPGFRDPSGFFPDYKPAQKVIESFLADAAGRKRNDPARRTR
ncbi:MAG TPA: hypothetical protein VHL58_10535 [Thermoanaerobaculia bacterium]|nr:hypothetical protein [Thermoanaerobaculia bacterium]